VVTKTSRTLELSQFILPKQLPAHVAIIMDGNGRWAQQRHLPRIAGHRAGLQMVRKVVTACAHWKISALTLFAFSSENWNRPPQEVQFLMNLFHATLLDEIDQLHQNNICLRIIGEHSDLSQEIQQAIAHAQHLTAHNTGLNLSVAINYGGHWDIVNATRKMAEKVKAGLLDPCDISEELMAQHLSLSDLPAPDLFIRTSGELRLSNFMLWQLAYAELYFPDVLWPDFDDTAFYAALCAYAKRERRYGALTEPNKVLEHA
jgi:undecaprenyl diphosphate synthase